MNNPPSPYPGASQPWQPGSNQESHMIYNYPEKADQASEAETYYGSPHAAGFPQPGYPPTQPMDPQAYMQYGNYPAPTQPGYVQSSQKGGNLKNNLWIALTALALLLLVASGSFYYYLQVRSTPEKTLQTYCTAVKNDDGKALYNTYSNDAQSQTDVEHLQQGLRLIEFFTGGIEDCSVNQDSVRENDPQASADIILTLASGRTSTMRLHLIDEGGQWKVENNALLP